MKQFFSLLTTAVFLVVFPGAGLAQKDAGIPPMLETQHPLSISTTQPELRSPQVENPKPVAPATKGTKTKKAHRKIGKRKTKVASHKKTTKTVKKKSATAKSRSKVAASR